MAAPAAKISMKMAKRTEPPPLRMVSGVRRTNRWNRRESPNPAAMAATVNQSVDCGPTHPPGTTSRAGERRASTLARQFGDRHFFPHLDDPRHATGDRLGVFRIIQRWRVA